MGPVKVFNVFLAPPDLCKSNWFKGYNKLLVKTPYWAIYGPSHVVYKVLHQIWVGQGLQGMGAGQGSLRSQLTTGDVSDV